MQFSFDFENNNLWTRTVFGRHCYSIEPVESFVLEQPPLAQWIRKLSADKSLFKRSTSARRKSEMPKLIDPFLVSILPHIFCKILF
jgi:hypothetical protein